MVVAGADGCPDGWVVCRREANGEFDTRILESLADACQGVSILAVDMPIGFLDIQTRGGRLCEQQARKLLGRKSSSVFSAPCRPALSAIDYENVRRMPPPHEVGLSKQAFGLFKKLNEVDQMLHGRSELRRIVHEVHPELAFRRMNVDIPVFASKKKPAGRAKRLELLKAHGFAPAVDRLKGAAFDDILDACACCWTAMLIAAGTATCLGPQDQRDRHGLPMNIWF